LSRPTLVRSPLLDKKLSQHFLERRKALDRAIQALEKYQRLIEPATPGRGRKTRSGAIVSETTAVAA